MYEIGRGGVQSLKRWRRQGRGMTTGERRSVWTTTRSSPSDEGPAARRAQPDGLAQKARRRGVMIAGGGPAAGQRGDDTRPPTRAPQPGRVKIGAFGRQPIALPPPVWFTGRRMSGVDWYRLRIPGGLFCLLILGGGRRITRREYMRVSDGPCSRRRVVAREPGLRTALLARGLRHGEGSRRCSEMQANIAVGRDPEGRRVTGLRATSPIAATSCRGLINLQHAAVPRSSRPLRSRRSWTLRCWSTRSTPGWRADGP